jgi:hypothetical protein
VEKYHREKDCCTKEATKLVLGSPLGATKLIKNQRFSGGKTGENSGKVSW